MLSSKTNAAARCPACMKQLDGATDLLGSRRPQPGDLSICAYCLVWLRFNDDLTLCLLTPRDIESLDDDTKQLLSQYGRVCFDALRAAQSEPTSRQ